MLKNGFWKLYFGVFIFFHRGVGLGGVWNFSPFFFFFFEDFPNCFIFFLISFKTFLHLLEFTPYNKSSSFLKHSFSYSAFMRLSWASCNLLVIKSLTCSEFVSLTFILSWLNYLFAANYYVFVAKISYDFAVIFWCPNKLQNLTNLPLITYNFAAIYLWFRRK